MFQKLKSFLYLNSSQVQKLKKFFICFEILLDFKLNSLPKMNPLTLWRSFFVRSQTSKNHKYAIDYGFFFLLLTCKIFRSCHLECLKHRFLVLENFRQCFWQKIINTFLFFFFSPSFPFLLFFSFLFPFFHLSLCLSVIEFRCQMVLRENVFAHMLLVGINLKK